MDISSTGTLLSISTADHGTTQLDEAVSFTFYGVVPRPAAIITRSPSQWRR
jgi:hypothetical protein